MSKKRPRGYTYRKWQQKVFKRDNYQCVLCGSTENLTADHVKPIVNRPELIYSVPNGRTLCNKCRVKDTLNSWENGLFKEGYHSEVKRRLSK